MVDAEDLREPGAPCSPCRSRRGHSGSSRRCSRSRDDGGGRALRLVREVERSRGSRACWRPHTRSRSRSRSRRRQVLRAGERGGVGRALQLALRVVGVADVDRERADAEQRDERERHHWQDLAALSTSPSHPRLPFRPRLAGPRQRTQPCSQIRSGFGGRHHPIGGSVLRAGLIDRVPGASEGLRGVPERVVPELPAARRPGHAEADEVVLGGGGIGIVVVSASTRATSAVVSPPG